MIPVRVSFLHPSPDPIGALREIGGVVPAFSAAREELVYRSSVRALSSTYARPLMAQLFECRLETLRDELADPSSVTARARAVVASLVTSGRADVARLAKTLAMSRPRRPPATC